MAKQTVQIGTTTNDNTGDPLRTAFDKINDNFDEIYIAGPVSSNISISGTTVSTATGQLSLTSDNGVIEVQGDLFITGKITGDNSSILEIMSPIVINSIQAENEIVSFSDPIKLPTLTTTERNALSTVANGTLIYNSTDTKIQAYAGGGWVDLH
tara:strand:+ start:672 stop:1133 length:462 start_codon:yes stop_codon:yes gene_type:complete